MHSQRPSLLPAALRNKFAAKLPDRVRAVVDAAEQALESGEPAHWEAARREAHQLAGTAGSYGFPEISRRLSSLERAIRGGAPQSDIVSCLRDIREQRAVS